ncbi:MAG: replication initiation factor domain-containing protein [Okeania sp. SIO2D1]|nr:replication initiation factor domain-containing protein [Okeania sp. SIO2D1]
MIAQTAATCTVRKVHSNSLSSNPSLEASSDVVGNTTSVVPEKNLVKNNTGDYGLSLSPGLVTGIDFLTFQVKLPDFRFFEKMLDFVFSFFNDSYRLKYSLPLVKGKRWEHSGVSAKRGQIAWNENSKTREIDAWVSLPGSLLHSGTVRDIWRMAVGLENAFGVENWTRSDCFIDDHLNSFTIDEALEAAGQANISRFKKFGYTFIGDVGEKPTPTGYFGSRRSEEMLRMYNTLIKHGYDALRLEAELKRRSSKAFMRRFIDLPVEGILDEEFERIVAPFLGSVVTGLVDFLDRDSVVQEVVDPRTGRVKNCYVATKKVSRSERLPFWDAFVKRVGFCTKLRPQRKKPTLDKTLEWLWKQVMVVLAVLQQGYGPERFYEWLSYLMKEAASHRFRDVHRALIDVIRREAEEGYSLEQIAMGLNTS